ncbi:MAG: metallopeptidase family protein [Nocardioides sp.]
MEVDGSEFDDIVALALDELPADFAALMDNVVVLIEDDAPADDPDLLGLYDGTALTERDADYFGQLPDRILIFRRPLLAISPDRAELEHQVRITVLHEIAHHFGLDDERLHELGYD